MECYDTHLEAGNVSFFAELYFSYIDLKGLLAPSLLEIIACLLSPQRREAIRPVISRREVFYFLMWSPLVRRQISEPPSMVYISVILTFDQQKGGCRRTIPLS